MPKIAIIGIGIYIPDLDLLRSLNELLPKLGIYFGERFFRIRNSL